MTVHDDFETLYTAERARLERIARRNAGSANAADIVQDVFATLWSRACDQFNHSPSYLSRATRYAAITHFRTEQRRTRLLGAITEEQYQAPVVLPDQIVSAREDLARMHAVINMLPERTRTVFLLNRFHGCTYEEIAAAMDLSYSTVERDIARAIVACKAAK